MTTKPKNLSVIDGVEHKDCSICRQTLPLSNFRIKKTQTGTLIYRSECIPCGNNGVKRFRDNMKARAVAYLGGKCQDCKRVHPLAVYDFHHLDPSQKEASISRLLYKKVNWDTKKTELDKCVLLCANCHRIRHSPVCPN